MYRVFNLDWEKVLSLCSQILLLNDLTLIFLCSTMFDVFCAKISLVCVKYFVHNINLKYFWLKLNLSLIHQNHFSHIFSHF